MIRSMHTNTRRTHDTLFRTMNYRSPAFADVSAPLRGALTSGAARVVAAGSAAGSAAGGCLGLRRSRRRSGQAQEGSSFTEAKTRGVEEELEEEGTTAEGDDACQ